MPKNADAKTFHVATLGCKINQYESEAIAEAWSALGYAEAGDAGTADVLLVNSCAVTNRAVSDLRAAVRRMRQQNPGARIIVTGCAAQVLAKDIAAMPEVDAVVPQDRKAALLAGPFGPKGLFEAFKKKTASRTPGRKERRPHAFSAVLNRGLQPGAGRGQGPGRLFAPLHLLHRAADARSQRKPRTRRRPGRDAPPA